MSHHVQSLSITPASCSATESLPSYHDGGDELVEVDELDAAHRQRHAHVHLRHVQVGVALCRVRVIHHAEVKDLLVCYRNSLMGEKTKLVDSKLSQQKNLQITEAGFID